MQDRRRLKQIIGRIQILAHLCIVRGISTGIIDSNPGISIGEREMA